MNGFHMRTISHVSLPLMSSLAVNVLYAYVKLVSVRKNEVCHDHNTYIDAYTDVYHSLECVFVSGTGIGLASYIC